MKNINLIKVVPPYRQQEIRRWLVISVVFLGSIFTAITILQIPQLRTWYQAKKENKTLKDAVHAFESVMDKKHALKQKQQLLRKKIKKLDSYIKQPKNPTKHITMFMNACEKTVHLDSLTMTKKTFKLTAACTKTEDATNFMQRLRESNEVYNLKLVSMQKNNQHSPALHFTMQGKK